MRRRTGSARKNASNRVPSGHQRGRRGGNQGPDGHLVASIWWKMCCVEQALRAPGDQGLRPYMYRAKRTCKRYRRCVHFMLSLTFLINQPSRNKYVSTTSKQPNPQHNHINMEKSKANSSTSANKKNLNISTSREVFAITSSSMTKLKMKNLEQFAMFLLSPIGVLFVSTLSGDDARRLLHDLRIKYNSHQDYADSITQAHQDALGAERAKRNDAAEAVSFLEKLLAQKKSEHDEAAAAVAALTVQAEKAEGLKADAFEVDFNLQSAMYLLREHIEGLE